MLNKKLPKNGSTVLPNPFKGLVIFYKSHLLLSIMIVSLLMGSTTATNLCHPAWTGVGHRPSYNDAPASTISYESTITTNYCCREVNVDGGYDGCTMDAEGCTCTETKYTSCSNEGRFQTMEEKKKYNYICVSNYHCNDAQYKPDDDTQANWVAIAWKKDDEECTVCLFLFVPHLLICCPLLFTLLTRYCLSPTILYPGRSYSCSPRNMGHNCS